MSSIIIDTDGLNPKPIDLYILVGKKAINFVEFSERNGLSTMTYLKTLQTTKWNIAGAEITANKEQAGPPVAKPINIEIKGDKFEELVENAQSLKRFLQESEVPGVADLKTDFVDNKPEIIFDIDRERANREGISSVQLAMEIRKAVFGIDNPSKFRDAFAVSLFSINIKNNFRFIIYKICFKVGYTRHIRLL